MISRPGPSPRPPLLRGDPEDLLTGWLLAATVLVAANGIALWTAGQVAGLLANGRWPHTPPTAALGIAARVPAHFAEPAQAWPAADRDQIPGPLLLYGVLIALVAATLTVALLAVSAWTQHRAAGPRRERDRSALWARPAEIRPLLVRGAIPGRVVLGRLARASRASRLWVAAESRRSVLVVAPTQTGKTSRIVVPTVLRWAGPMLVTSVKADVLRLTLTERMRRGPAYVFDPTGAVTNGGLTGSGIDAAIRNAAVKWSPLLRCASYPDAERTAAWLIEAGGDPRGENATFWESLAAKLLAPLLYAAAGTDRPLRDVATWIDRRETTDITEALSTLGDLDALDAWAASCAREERQRDSVYATTEAILRAFASPSARAATDITANDRATGRVLDVDRLLTEAGTLYLVAPAHEQGRLRPLFESLVQAVLRAAQNAYALSGQPLYPALMVMLDEAANIAPLRQLHTHAATGAGQGIQICSVWQDLAQVEALYGRRAATVINGHTARVFLAGSADLATLDATSRMIGDHQTRRATISTSPDGGRSISEHTADARLAPPEYLRQLPPNAGVLLYGRAPPILLTTTPWYADPALRRLVDRAAAAESESAAGTDRSRLPWRRRRQLPPAAHPHASGHPQISPPRAAASSGAAPSHAGGDHASARRPSTLTTGFEHRSCLMEPTAAIRDIASCLAASKSPLEAAALAWRAADLAEAASLRLVHAGDREDLPGYLSAADAFAAVRTDLDDYADPDMTSTRAATVGFTGDADQPASIEYALADLARTTIVALTTAARDSDDRRLALACSQAALSAADAAEATTRGTTQ